MTVITNKSMIAECQTKLLAILDIWPKQESDRVNSFERLKPYVTDNFNKLDLLHSISGVKQWVDFLQVDSKVEIHFLDNTWRHRAVFFVDATNKSWKLESQLFICPSCFAGEVSPKESCTMCGGTGWGAYG